MYTVHLHFNRINFTEQILHFFFSKQLSFGRRWRYELYIITSILQSLEYENYDVPLLAVSLSYLRQAVI